MKKASDNTSHTFVRAERLKSEQTIGQLFKEGTSYVAYPLRVVWLPVEPTAERGDAPAQIAISVPKRNFKTATARNLLKRRIREAYRLHKHVLYEKLTVNNQHIAIMLLFIAKETLLYSDIEAGVQKMIRKFPG